MHQRPFKYSMLEERLEQVQDMRQDIARLESRLDEKINGLESRLRDDMKQLGDRVGRLEHGQARRVAGRVARGHHRTGLV